MYSNNFNNIEQESDILRKLDENLKKEIIINQKLNFLREIPFFFFNFSRNLLIEVCLAMEESKFFPH